MTKTIEQLWYGDLDPIRYLGKTNTELKQMEGLLEQNEERLSKHLGDKEKEIPEKYHDCMKEYTILVSEQAFCDGFCLGTKIVTEALSGAEQLLQ